MRPPKKPAKVKAKPVKKDTRPQRERFEEAAREAGGIDEDVFEKAMERIAPPKKTKR